MRYQVGKRMTIRKDVKLFKRADGLVISEAMTKDAGKTGYITEVIDRVGYKLSCSKYWWPYCLLIDPEVM